MYILQKLIFNYKPADLLRNQQTEMHNIREFDTHSIVS